jgi:hypothetical protein
VTRHWDAAGAGSRPRSTWPATALGGRWPCWSPPASGMRAPSWDRCWTRSGCPGPGRVRPRKRPAHLTADRGYSYTTCRRLLRQRRIAHTIPERSDQQAARARRGARGGRPPAVDPVRYRTRNVVERAIARLKQHRAIAPPATTSWPSATTAGWSWPPCCSGSQHEPSDRP